MVMPRPPASKSQKIRTGELISHLEWPYVESPVDKVLAVCMHVCAPCFSIVMLELVDLSSLLYQLRPHWKKLSDSLRIPITKKDEIADQLSVETCLMDLLRIWIVDSSEGLVTFEALIRGLESHSVENRALAYRISEDIEVLNLLKVSADDPGTI